MYTTLAEVRSVPPLSESVQRYPDDALTEGIAWAELRIDEITDTAWGNGTGDYKTDTIYLSELGTSYKFYIGNNFVRSIVSAKIGGVTVTTSAWKLNTDTGLLTADVPFDSDTEIVVKYGATKIVPADISWAARTLARWYVLKLNSQVPDNAVNIVSEGGTVVLAQPGRYGATALPEVNAVLASRSHKFPSVG